MNSTPRSLNFIPPHDSAKVLLENVNHPGSRKLVDAVRYNAMKRALLQILPRTSPGLTVEDVQQRVVAHLPQELFPGGAASGWWTKAVQLDLEAKGLVAREKCTPIRLHTTGRSTRGSRAPKPTYAKTVDQYVAGFPPAVQTILARIRQTVKAVAPEAEETISYRMPTFKLNGKLVYFAAFQKHIGLYPPVRGDDSLIQAVQQYAGPKGNLQFPFEKPIPYALIRRIVKARVRANSERKPKRQSR